MASIPSRKKTKARVNPRARRIADLTTDELSEMIEELIERKLAGINSLPSSSINHPITKQMRRNAASAAGRFHSGVSDISAKHDDYLTTSYL